MPNIDLINYSPALESKLLDYLDQNRKYNVELDPLGLREYESDWAEKEKQKVLEIIGGNKGEVLFIELDKNIIGFVYYFMEDEDKKVIHLSKIFIEQNFRGSGYGKEVLNKLELLLKQKGYKYISLNVFSPNTIASALYKRSGYKERFVDMMKEI
jgi:ribosomal protein S18 acetylase RimI-like enzyme